MVAGNRLHLRDQSPQPKPCPQPRPGALEDLAPFPWAHPIFTPCCLESEAALVLWQEGNLMPPRDGRSTGEER